MSGAMPETPLDLTAIAVRALMLYSLVEFQRVTLTTIRSPRKETRSASPITVAVIHRPNP
jgi:hypothetical protein